MKQKNVAYMNEFMENKINIVILMAGLGSRFDIAKYPVPKPFIEFNNKMMIEHVLNSFKNVDANFIIVLQEKFLEEQRNKIEKLLTSYKLHLITVPKLTMGAAITALAAHKIVNPGNDIIFADADNIFKPQDVSDFIDYARANELAGAMMSINSNNPCFSYAKVDDNGYLIETREKEVISSNAICGLYYFKNIDEFKDAVIDLVVCTDLSRGEFYMSNVYNHLKMINPKIGIFSVEHFDCVGTPEQLDKYIEEHLAK